MGTENFSWVIEGVIGGMSKPGLECPLEEDLARLRSSFGIHVLMSLTQQPLNAEVVAAAGLDYHHFPIADFTAPSLETVRAAVAVVESARAANKPIAVHCFAGLGRTGTLLACVLTRFGTPPHEAIATIRRLRPGSIETPAQEDVILEYWASLGL